VKKKLINAAGKISTNVPGRRMIVLKSPEEIDLMYGPNQIVAETHVRLREEARPGMTTWDLEEIAREQVDRHNVTSAFLGYRGYPCMLCTSINEAIVHGVPRKDVVLKEGDIVSIDFGVVSKEGFVGDAALSFILGGPEAGTDAANKLVNVTEECLYKAIDKLYEGNRLGDIGAVVQEHAESNGFSVVRDFVGHGIGKDMHEEPQVTNFGKAGTGVRLKVGMVLALEPMVNIGGPEVEVLSDKWTALTADRSLSAHWEHSVAITADGPRILSALGSE